MNDRSIRRMITSVPVPLAFLGGMGCASGQLVTGLALVASAIVIDLACWWRWA